jgi:tetratricopeptide (TPR) repeat protein
MRTVIWLSMCIVLLAACGAPPAPATTAPQTALPAAPTPASHPPAMDLSAELNALKAGDTATAITGLEKILANAPASSEAHLLLGQAYYRAGQKDKAQEQWMAAFQLNPAAVPLLDSQDADEWLKVGNAHASLNQLDQALAAYQTALKIRPDTAAALTNIGTVYYQQGKFDEAAQQMHKALAIDPGDAETHYMLGATYVQQALGIEPNGAETPMLGATSVQQQKLDEAEKSFNKAIELKPDLAEAYTGLGNVQLARKNTDEAVKTLQKATALKPDQAEAWLALGQAYAAQGNTTEAGQALNQCLQSSQPGPLRLMCEQVRQQLGTP